MLVASLVCNEQVVEQVHVQLYPSRWGGGRATEDVVDLTHQDILNTLLFTEIKLLQYIHCHIRKKIVLIVLQK